MEQAFCVLLRVERKIIRSYNHVQNITSNLQSNMGYCFQTHPPQCQLQFKTYRSCIRCTGRGIFMSSITCPNVKRLYPPSPVRCWADESIKLFRSVGNIPCLHERINNSHKHADTHCNFVYNFNLMCTLSCVFRCDSPSYFIF